MSPIDYLYYLCFVFFAFGGSFFFKKGIVATKFLGLLFIVLGLQTFLNYYIRPEYLLIYPHFFRTVSPLMLTIGPLYYLFQQFLLYPERKFKPVLLLHFLPFALHVIEYIPFYILPTEVKILEIKEMISENTIYTIHSKYGWITMRNHLYIRFSSFLIYVTWGFVDLLKYYQSASKSFIKNNLLIVYWLFFNMGMKFIVMGLIIYNLIYPDKKQISLPWKDFFYLVEYVLMMLFMLFNPKLLYGPTLKGLIWQQALGRLDGLEEVGNNKDISVKIVSGNERERALLDTLNRYFETERIFLKPTLTLIEVARKLKVKPRLIRLALQSEMDISFSDYVNTWRIQYAEEQCRENPRWKNYKLEVVALESGFGTRQSFNSAVKKIKGVSPGQYFSEFLY
ncbi:helix-turn-helix transcriptional regulator [Aquirufa aurantiipilula]|uniref:Helix-turn-helix transcriptional regulator n=1 Tax=Aquirufa aurantiipilula TaxID=2696561 RepID=A0ABT6BLX3_9BACT|nr:helix-turn-helix transcriptional regulator [Aquirufa aurantiipilula]MBZ1326945.1 helix-turn-helix transcriptional regulator [Aquirufa aurantiipilula]MDF5691185.1 helix-turn-helix transcriptional regulator [Aquirufa aurantiipilula]